MFVTHTCLCTNFLPLQLVVTICSQDILCLLEVVCQVIVHLVFSIVILEILAFTLVVSQNIFRPEVDVVHIVYRIGIIQLERMFIRTGIVIIILVTKKIHIIRIIFDVFVFRIGFTIVRRTIITIRESEVFTFLLEGMLIVEIGPDTAPIACSPVNGTITVGMFVQDILYLCTAVPITIECPSKQLHGKCHQV